MSAHETVTLSLERYDALCAKARKADRLSREDEALIDDEIVKALGPEPNILNDKAAWEAWWTEAEDMRKRVRLATVVTFKDVKP
jgi:hypothetical protein